MAYRRGIHDVYLQTTASSSIPTALSGLTRLGQTTVEGVNEEAFMESTKITGHTLGNTALSTIVAGFSMKAEFTLNEYKLAVSTVDPFLQWLNTLGYGNLGPNVGQHLDASLQRTLLLVPLFSVASHDLQRMYYRVLPSAETGKRCIFDPRDIVRNPISFEMFPHFVTPNYIYAEDLASPLV
jgi:hypothetical protein